MNNATDEVASFHSDVLVIGCGIAGASAALEAAQRGLTRQHRHQGRAARRIEHLLRPGRHRFPGRGRRPRDPGGGHHPDRRRHQQPRGRGGPGQRTAGNSSSKILIDELKIPFTRSSPEALDYAQEAGHSRRRILHVKDTTGRTIEEKFVEALKGMRPRHVFSRPHRRRPADRSPPFPEPDGVLPGAAVPGRLRPGSTAPGSSAPSARNTTVLATGGCGAVYLFTSNPRDAIGAGYAMAHRAGARIVNMEYIQFHPTTLHHRDAEGFLISETVRGEGARLKTRDGRTFMEKYSDRKDLAPRDEVSRAIYEEMTNSDSSFVLLDLASYARIDIPKRFPNIYRTCLRVRHRHHQGADPRRPGGALQLRRGARRQLGAELAQEPLRRGRGLVHRVSTAPTAWPRPRSSKGWSGGRAPPGRSPPVSARGRRVGRRRSTLGTIPRTRRRSTPPSSTRTG